MNWFVYLIERSSYNCKVKELRATLGPIKVDNIEIDSKQKFGARFKGEKTESVQYLGEINGKTIHTRQELQEKLLEYVKKWQSVCFYEFNEQKYLILPPSGEKMGVWKENGVIYHQVRPNSIHRESEVVLLGNVGMDDNDDDILVGFNQEAYFKVWKRCLFGLLCRGKAMSVAMLASFAMAYNYWLYIDHYQARFIYKNSVDMLRNGQAYYNTDNMLPIEVAFVRYPRYWVHSWKGMTIEPQEFYSSLAASQLTYAYYLYAYEFWAYISEELKEFLS